MTKIVGLPALLNRLSEELGMMETAALEIEHSIQDLIEGKSTGGNPMRNIQRLDQQIQIIADLKGLMGRLAEEPTLATTILTHDTIAKVRLDSLKDRILDQLVVKNVDLSADVSGHVDFF
ncbi:hypothetical protein [Mesobacterium pallidum]|uniref:hypothetical protein n=1 Tax=Mesobacterium pallidum TaxID=2872037 RepID=UPI001EE357BE|nr:hypothetical protein [Mesobacterium pallidum]